MVNPSGTVPSRPQTDMEPCLTIGVPTFNRADLLPRFFSSLLSATAPVADHVIVNIFDNCSTDRTESICRQIAEEARITRITYHRNDRNIGAVGNIVSLIRRSTTEYFMFLGDDDYLIPDGIEEVVTALHALRPSAVIQAAWDYRPEARSRSATFEEALDYFYEFGNSWAGIMHGPTARALLDDPILERQVLQSAWPQTALGYMSMWRLRHHSRPFLLGREVGAPMQETRRRLSTPEYWVRSLDGLVASAIMVDGATGSAAATSQFLRTDCRGLTSHLHAIAMERALEGFRDVECKRLVSRLLSLGNPRAWVCAWAVRAVCLSPVLKPLMVLAWSTKRWASPMATSRRLAALAQQRSQDAMSEREAGRITAEQGLDGDRP